MKSTCENCRFNRIINPDISQCRRHSPTWLGIVSTDRYHYETPNAGWPITKKYDWCGDWEKEEEKKNGE